MARRRSAVRDPLAAGGRNASSGGHGVPVEEAIHSEREPPSLSMARRMVTTSAGTAQKSPQIHKMAAPIC